ncbi:unnamed protein product [Pseudo-nitzschia multistriata]|uniref:Uncharacterized protein n=1 Tax=Pseudo-nitzschia multistriata TaxID=183589 RepID=A0A448ZBB5_9STRA|nr:unnamed protein product [Pseudo-nitzschia multistriata]
MNDQFGFDLGFGLDCFSPQQIQQPQAQQMQHQQQQVQHQQHGYLNNNNDNNNAGNNGPCMDGYNPNQVSNVLGGRAQHGHSAYNNSINASGALHSRNNSQQQQQQQQQQQRTNRSNRQHTNRQQRRCKSNPTREEWLEKLKIPVSGVSLEPMTGTQILQRLKERFEEVSTRYLPCVDFLVQCQQELRKGLQVATTKRYVHSVFRDTLTSREFHTQYISKLPDRFYRKNNGKMTPDHLREAYKELQKLVANSKDVESQGCEAVKNTFLGGMKDGESWGLRKWLSKHGGALHICNDTECMSTSCQKLDRELETTRKLAERLRPMAAKSLKKLKSDIPASYQEQSSAHPYLPFFHRLECALRAMSNFDPEDDDVICIIDDDEVEELKAKAAAASSSSSSSNKAKRRSSAAGKSKTSESMNGNRGGTKRKHQQVELDIIDPGDDSDVEVLEQKPPPRRTSYKNNKRSELSTETNASRLEVDGISHNEKTRTVDEIFKETDNELEELFKTLEDDPHEDMFYDHMPKTDNISKYDAYQLADGLDSLATLFDTNQHDKVRPDDFKQESFWDRSYPFASALRLFSEILRSPDCSGNFLESVDDLERKQEGIRPYKSIVKHPLCFRDICCALLEDFNQIDNSITCSDGKLTSEKLQIWNMWKGMDLLQAIDLVFLNSLAYGKANEAGTKSNTRSKTNRLRKVLWSGIKEVIDASLGKNGGQEERRKCTPTRRGESSGFVVYKGVST